MATGWYTAYIINHSKITAMFTHPRSVDALSADNVEIIEKLLTFVYGGAEAGLLKERILAIINQHLTQREVRQDKPIWDETDVVLISYGDSLIRSGEHPLRTLDDFATQHLPQAISTIHLLPVYPWSSDDGFSVINYQQIDPKLGDWHDIERLSRHFDLMMDFVLNHCSRESLWFNDFLLDQLPGKHFFIEVDPATDLSKVIRPRTSPLLAEINTRSGKRYVWATFSHDQIDLNYRNPDVLLEFISIMLFYIRHGARILRLDAIAYLWKEIGTSCIHLPQTHAIVKLFREIIRESEPGVILLTETNVPHEENISYFGNGDEAHAVYQFSLPPLLLHALHTGTTDYLQAWAKQLPPPPPGCTYLNFTASHDGIGMRPLEGLIPKKDIDALIKDMQEKGGFVSTKTNADGSESPYELNISYFSACHDGDHGQHKERFLLTQTVAMSLQGIAAVYIHSLLATPNDIQGVQHSGMTRTINRRKWKIDELQCHLSAPDSIAGDVFNEYLRRLEIRRQQPAFHPDGSQEILDLEAALFGFVRHAPDSSQTITTLYNFTPTAHAAPAALLHPGTKQWRDLITGKHVSVTDGKVKIPAYGCYWLVRTTPSARK